MRSFFLLLILAGLLSSCGVRNTVTSPVVSGKIDGNYTGCAIGAFVNGLENLADFQTMSNKTLAVVLWYVHWQEAFPSSDADTVYRNGSVPLITWEPWITNGLGTLEAIATGSYETYVTEFLTAAKAWGKPMFLRFAHEMNGNWYPWDGAHNGSEEAGERYKRAWIYIYNVKEAVGAANVTLVWSPNNTDLPNEAWNTPEAYYPGDQYVDWIGMDGYNWGYAGWEDFDQIFSSVYQKLTSLTGKPLMIGEFSSAEQGGDKAVWISDVLTRIKSSYPRVKALCWFNIDKERDWRVNSSVSAEAAWRGSISDSYFDKSLL